MDKNTKKITVPTYANQAGMNYFDDVVRAVLGQYSEQSPVVQADFDEAGVLVFGAAVQITSRECGIDAFGRDTRQVEAALAMAHDIERVAIVDWLFSKDWDHPKQIITALSHAPHWAASMPHVRLILGTAIELMDDEIRLKNAITNIKTILDQQPDLSGPCAQVFDKAALAKARKLVQSINSEIKSNTINDDLRQAQRNGGWRARPDFNVAQANLAKLKLEFENFGPVINRLENDLLLASLMPEDDFSISPLLLLGPPGVGKTLFCHALAKALGSAMVKITAAGAQGGFQLTGSNASWRDSAPGRVFKAFAESETCCPVVLIDEVDRINKSDQHPVIPVLLELLDPVSSESFRDEFFEVEFDASMAVNVLTANSLTGVPDALLSRCEVFTITMPNATQRLRIIENEANHLKEKLGREIALDWDTASRVAEADDMDMRKVQRLVKNAFAEAIKTGKTTAVLEAPPSKFNLIPGPTRH